MMMLCAADEDDFVSHRRRRRQSPRPTWSSSATSFASNNCVCYKQRRRVQEQHQHQAAKCVVALESSAVSTTAADCNHHQQQQQQHSIKCARIYAQKIDTDCRKRLSSPSPSPSSSSTAHADDDDNKPLMSFKSHHRCRHSVRPSSLAQHICRIKVCNFVLFSSLLLLLTCQHYYVQLSLCSPSLTSSTTTTTTTTTKYPPPHSAGGAALLLLSSPTGGVVPPPHIAALLLQASRSSSAIIPPVVVAAAAANLTSTTKSERLTEAPAPAASATKKVHDFTALQAEVPPDISRQLSNQSMPGQNFNNNNNNGGGGGSINDVCLQAPDYGHCSAKHERFTFNSASRKCQPFIWSGCGGNENRFFSEQQCYDACYGQTGFNPNTHRGIAEQQQQQQNSRQQPNSIPAATNDWERAAAAGGMSSGAGGTLQPQFSGGGGGGGNEYYNNNNNVDVINFSGGGGGVAAAAAAPPPPPGSSATAPVAAVAASSAAVSGNGGSGVGVVKHVDLRCYEPVKRGMCSKYIPRWYFNGTQCDMFYYSGCGPTTENNFATVEDCVSTCAVHKSPGELRQEVCSLEAERGYCGGPSSLTSSTPSTTPPSSSASPSIAASGIALPQIKWYYNLVEQTCSQFVWSTCEGNSNRFDAKQDCLNLCQGFSKSEKHQNSQQTPTTTNNNIVIDNNGRIVLQPPISVHQPNQQQFHAPGVVHQDPLAQHQLPHSSHNFINNLLQQHYSPQSQPPPQNQNNFGAFSPTPTEHQGGHQSVGVTSTNTNRPNPSWPISPSSTSSQTIDDYFTSNQHQSSGVGVGSGGMLPQPPPLLPTQTPLAPSRPQQNQRQPPMSPPGVGGGVGVGVSGGPVSQHHPQRQQEYPRLPNTQHLPSECAMPADKGSCLQDIKRWYFDAINLRCRPFYWSGCGGSYNNFISHSECEDRCIVAVAVSNVNNNRTILTQNNSPGGGLARPAAQPGAPGRSPAVVSTAVVDETSPPPECLLPVERGPCLGETLRYGYDVADNSCKAFMYGCGGNENNFLTENDCLFRCSGGSGGGGGLQNSNQNAALFRPNFMRPRSGLEGISNDPSNAADPAAASPAAAAAGATAAVMPPSNKQQLTALQSQINSICLLPLAEGFCSSKHPRYYYNADTEQCQPFGYTGCGGNENSFPTMNDCIETCSMSTVPMTMHSAASAPAQTTTTSQHSARAPFFSLSTVPGSPLTQPSPYDGSSHIGSLADASSGTTAFHDAFWPPSVNQRIVAANNGGGGETAVDFLSSPSVLMDGINILDAPQMLLKKIRTNSAASAAGGGGPINSKVQLNYVGGGGGSARSGAAPDRRSGTSLPALLPPSLAPQPRTSLRTKLQQAAAAASSSASASNSAGVNKNFLFHNNHYLNDFALIDTMPFLQKRLRSSSSNTAGGRSAPRRHAYEGQNEAFGGPQAANDNNNNPSEFFSPYNNDAASAPPLPEPQPQHNRFMKARPLQTDVPVPKNYLHSTRAKPAKLIVSVTLDPPAEEGSAADALPKLLVKNSSTNAAAVGTKTKLIKKSTKLSTVSAASAAAARHGKTARSTSSLLSEIQSTSTVRTTPVPPNYFRITSRTTNPVTSLVSSSSSSSAPSSTAAVAKATPPTPPTITTTAA